MSNTPLCVSSYIHRLLEVGFKWEPLLSLTHFWVVWISDECPWLVSPRFFKAFSWIERILPYDVCCILQIISCRRFNINWGLLFWKWYFPSKIENWKSIQWCPRMSSSDFLMGVCHPVFQILTLISDHCRCHFRLSPLKSIPVFRTDINRNYVIITQIRTPAKRFLYKIHFKLALQLLLLKPSYSFGTETTNRFIHSTQFRTKRSKFSDQNGPKTIPYGTVHTIW